MIFGGIIDILQQYGTRKQLEHGHKPIRYHDEREGISVTDPRPPRASASSSSQSSSPTRPRRGASRVFSPCAWQRQAWPRTEPGAQQHRRRRRGRPSPSCHAPSATPYLLEL